MAGASLVSIAGKKKNVSRPQALRLSVESDATGSLLCVWVGVVDISSTKCNKDKFFVSLTEIHPQALFSVSKNTVTFLLTTTFFSIHFKHDVLYFH